MIKIIILSLLMAVTFTAYSAESAAPGTIYTLSMPKPANHLLEVEATFYNIPEGQNVLDVLLPAWRPGRYLILDFANGIQEFSAADERQSQLQWKKTDKSTWRIHTNGARAVTVRYRVYANEFDKKTRGLDIDHAFVSGESVFMYTESHRNRPIELMIHPYGTWHVTTGLDDAKGKVNTYKAPTYDYFIDCPIEIGTQKDYEFTVEGKRHIISLSGQGNWNADTLIRDCSRIVTANKQMWGSLPYEKYVFLFHCLPRNGGGVEHINSTIIGISSYEFQNPPGYAAILSLISHEFFHTWNVKQLRPHGLHPYDFQHENYARELWIAEGTTSYYGPLMLIKAGIRTGGSYSDNLEAYIGEERTRPGNALMSVNEASFDAWIKYWRSNENAYNAESDYYNKGMMVSALLDVEIRHHSNNAKSLDDVMRLMYERYPLSGTGYTVDDFKKTAEECAGENLDEFFARCVNGTSPLPWEETLLHAGLVVKPNIIPPKISFGMAMQQGQGEKIMIARVLTNSPAENAGLQPDDEIIAFDGVRATIAELNERIGRMDEGTQARITYFRDAILKETVVTAGRFGPQQYTVRKTDEPTPLQKSIYESWLHTPWTPPTAPGK